jgi:hypothetical protein
MEDEVLGHGDGGLWDGLSDDVRLGVDRNFEPLAGFDFRC